MFEKVPVTYFGCTHRAIPPERTIANVEGKLRRAGVTRIAEITHLDRLGIPVYSAIRPGAAEGAVSIYAGKGATKSQAKASAMMEAFERYSAEINVEDAQMFETGLYGEMEGAINPETLILPQQSYKADTTRLDWIKTVDVTDDEEYLAPVNAIYHPYIPRGGAVLFKSNTNGLASGNRIEEAVYHGITEVVERDAWSIFEAKKKCRGEVVCDGTENPLIRDMLHKFDQSEIEVKLLDLTADVDITTIAAVADDTVLRDPALLSLGVGTHLNPEVAVIRALTEVAQSRATQIHGTREDTNRAVFMRKAGYERMKRINKHWFSDSHKLIDISRIKDKSKPTFKEDIETCVNILKKNGFDKIYYTNLTRREIEIPVARVIIPGMEVYSVDMERMGKRLI
ncbi:MAG: YcaO-related McrA-glycine thioamidation protein [Methanobacteriaceae archaeon]|nr:YcaO-related McrA-glycine thioamidation protein [Methanobacteriaceae archaeon]